MKINKIERVYDVPTRYREVVLTVSKLGSDFSGKAALIVDKYDPIFCSFPPSFPTVIRN